MTYENYTDNGAGRQRSAEEIQHDLEAIRAEMGDTLRQLEDRFSPRALLDETLQRFRTAGGGTEDFLQNLGSTVRDNPVGVLLLATGAASLLISQRTGGAAGAKRMGGETGASAKERMGDAKQRIGEVMGQAKEKKSQLNERIHDAGGQISGRMHDASGRMHEASDQLRKRGEQLVHEHPMVLLGLGLALGSALAGSTPMSKRERQVLGPAADRLKQEVAGEAQEGAKQAGAMIQDDATEARLDSKLGKSSAAAGSSALPRSNGGGTSHGGLS